jgi:hypothetical protein
LNGLVEELLEAGIDSAGVAHVFQRILLPRTDESEQDPVPTIDQPEALLTNRHRTASSPSGSLDATTKEVGFAVSVSEARRPRREHG